MDEEGIEAVLAKAVDLRLKIINRIHRATNNSNKCTSLAEEEALEENGDKKMEANFTESLDEEGLLSEEDEEAAKLLHIRDALESLELQLSNLQDLQQQQRYEKEVALGEIEHSRKMLLDKLKEYKGEDLEVIREASVFAGETVEHSNDLLLPPYPSRPPQALDFHYSRKPTRNGLITGDEKKLVNGSEIDQARTNSKNSGKGLGHVIGAAAKTVISVVGLLSLLSLSGFGPNIGKGNIPFKIAGFFQQPANEEKRKPAHCPTGRVLVLEDGEARCIVKERVAVPFESVVAKPDVNYGSG